ncbi:hypothetical protein [Sagittula marina]|uniref:hypothetical protein n=1 Tax=Sagittula marina TaxID=943940 RepID=UPI0031D474C1
MSLKPGDIEPTTKGKNIRDPQLQNALCVATKGKDGKDLEQALRAFSEKDSPYQGLRRVRLIETLQKSARVEIGETEKGKPLKAYMGDSNYCSELWKLPNGKIEPKVVTTYEAHTGIERRPHPAAKRILRIFKKDMVAIERENKTKIYFVQKLDRANGLFLAPHKDANCDARYRDKTDPFKFLQMGSGTLVKSKIRRVVVDEIGCIRDPGPLKI